MQEFYIKKDSLNPLLEMELIDDGRYSYKKSIINESLQDSVVTFTMIDTETNIPKISKAKANIVLKDDDSCEKSYILQYKWNSRDVNKCGVFKGVFEITFNGNLLNQDEVYPIGNLKVPIEEDLIIIVK